MKVINIHERIIAQPIDKVIPLLNTLATRQDQIWPKEKWPGMRLDQGLAVGSRGGHGPIRYHIDNYVPGELIQFRFERPKGFAGVHRLSVSSTGAGKTKLHHIIDMQTSGRGTLVWLLAIRWLHDALIEDAFDKVENHFSAAQKRTPWSWWVKTLRFLLR